MISRLHCSMKPIKIAKHRALNEAVRDRVRDELEHCLSLGSGGCVERSGDPLVMALVVSDDEVGVQESQIKKVSEETVETVLSVAQLMTHDNASS